MFHKSLDLPSSHLLRVAVVILVLTIVFVDGFDTLPIINPSVRAAAPFFVTCSPPCQENFDSVTRPALPAGWTSTISNAIPGDLLWRTVNTSSFTSPNSAFAGGPDHVTDNRLISRTYAAISTPAVLSFRRRNDFETNFDGMVLEISIDGGSFVDIVSAGGSFISGGYNATMHALTGSPIGGRQAWTGNTGASYLTTSVNLPSSVNGRNVSFRWRVATDDSVESAGAFLDNIALTERPPNDNFANAQPILGESGVINGSNAGATKEPGEPNHAGSFGDASIWYRWQAPSTGRFVFSTFGSDPAVNTVLAMYTGNSLPGTNVASNDDELDCFFTARYSRVGFDAVGGVVYHIAIDKKGDATGNITLRWARAANISGRISTVSGAPGATGDPAIRLQGDGACRRSELPFSVLFRDVAIGGNYNITVTSTSATFNPWASNPSISPLTGSVTTFNFFKIFPAYSISGKVTVPDGNEIGLTVMCVSLPGSQNPSNPVNFVISRSANISADGSYICAALPEHGDYVVTPSKPGVRFTPVNKTFQFLAENKTNENFSGDEAPFYVISGRVTHPNGTTGVSGVSVALSGTQTASKVTDANGNYSFTGVLEGGNYTVTPSNVNFTFTPTNRSFNNVIANQTADFTVTFLLQLILDNLGQVAALDSMLLTRDPFPVINNANPLNGSVDRNTRVAIFLSNFQLGSGESPSSVVINLVGSNSQSYDIPAEDVRSLPDGLTRVTFRLPDTLTAGTCTLLVKAHGLTSNMGAMSIK